MVEHLYTDLGIGCDIVAHGRMPLPKAAWRAVARVPSGRFSMAIRSMSTCARIKTAAPRLSLPDWPAFSPLLSLLRWCDWRFLQLLETLRTMNSFSEDL